MVDRANVGHTFAWRAAIEEVPILKVKDRGDVSFSWAAFVTEGAIRSLKTLRFPDRKLLPMILWVLDLEDHSQIYPIHYSSAYLW